MIKHVKNGVVWVGSKKPVWPCVVPSCPDKGNGEKCDYKNPKTCATWRAFVVHGLPFCSDE